MLYRTLATLALLAFALLPASAAELAGTWSAQFDTQIGPQKYTFEFTSTDGQLAGKATFDHSMGKGTVQLREIKVDGEKVAFKESLSIEGNEITISYHGTLTGDEMKLTREVGEFATEQLTATRTPAKK